MTIEQLFDDIIIDYCEQGIAINNAESLISAIEECEDYKTHIIDKAYGIEDIYTVSIKLISRCTWSYVFNYRLNEDGTINILVICDFDRRMNYKNK